MVVGIVGFLIALFVQIYLSNLFSDIARDKGHEPCFWFCFFFGIIGFVYVAALPNNALDAKIRRLEQELAKKQTPAEPSSLKAPAPAPAKKENATPQEGALFAEIVNDMKICPKCKREQKADRRACWYCSQKFEN